MELTFSELSSRDVINVVDGKCLGRPKDIKLSFPDGILVGIFVPGKKQNFFSKIFDKSSIFIDVTKINKIGGDVILVNMNCGDTCSPSVRGTTPIERNICNPCVPFCCGQKGEGDTNE